MCLITEQKKPIKIRKDMVVYKLVRPQGYNVFSPWADWNKYTYFLNKLNVEEMKYKIKGEWGRYATRKAMRYYNCLKNLTEVNEGFHSANSLKGLDHLNTHPNDKVVAVKCIIPAGSLVFKDKTGLIVSNQIKLIEVIKN
jgi:hypothetical protein